MGMAASQARFLSLTARKSNVEYEGQQINQERTTLANMSSNLFGQLSKLDVPTPPRTNEFYKTVYTFNSKDLGEGNNNIQYTLDEIYSTPSGDKAVLSWDEIDYTAASLPIKMIQNSMLTPTGEGEGPSEEVIGDKTYANMMVSFPGDESYPVYVANASDVQNDLGVIAKENSKFQTEFYPQGVDNPIDSNKQVYYFKIGNKTYYFPQDESAEAGEKGSLDIAMCASQITKTQKQEFDVVNHETSESGRTSSITIKIGEGNEAQEFTYDIDCTSVEDEEAYEQAMLDYEYAQAKYKKEVSDLNAKTEDIQQKDKMLELELKQLDTEQNAINTEMEAVSKIVEQNVEGTFKTFG